MSEKRQFELLLVRLVPHALRDDFMTVGVVVVESLQPSAVSDQEGQKPKSQTSAVSHQVEREQSHRPSDGSHQRSAVSHQAEQFAEARFTRDWKRVECFAPDLEMEIFEHLEKEVREGVKEIRGRDGLVQLLEERFGTVFDVGPVKALEAEDPAAEMRVLERDYLAPMMAERGRGRERHTGRAAIVGRMQGAFAEAGVLELLQRDLDMREFTGENDPFRVDFGFRVGAGDPGKTLKMFQGLAMNLSREPAVMLAYRYGRIRDGMRSRGEDALLTAVVAEDALRTKGEVAFGIAMLRASAVEVRGVNEMGEIAERVMREVRG